jgi:hypothetical protein
MADPDQKESHFHAMRSLAHYFANRGYRTTQSFEEFYDYLLKEWTADRFTQVLAAGIIADLHEIACTQGRCLNEIERQSSSVVRLLEHLSDSAAKRPIDPIADACLCAGRDRVGRFRRARPDGMATWRIGFIT